MIARKWTRGGFFRLGLCAILLGTWVTACGSFSSPQIKGTLEDECTEKKDLAIGASVSLAPTQDGKQFGMKSVNNEWQGETGVIKTDGSGVFTFNNIPEGKYGLFILQVQVINAQGESLVIDVKKGSSQNLGVIKLAVSASGGCQVINTSP